MHRALFVLDVLQEILAHVPDDETMLLSSQMWIAALARTCKTFHEPAMDLLWADMHDHGIQPFLGCVTRLHPMIYQHDRQDFRSERVEALSELEARQFLRHTARVRSMRVKANHHFYLLTVLPIGTCVFPRLLALTWYPESDTGLFLFSSPTLRRCNLSVAPSLRSIEPCYRRLESLSIRSAGWTGHKAIVLSMSEAIRLCKQLKHLHCPPLNSAGWNYLSNLPTLVSVTISERFDVFPFDDDVLPFLSRSPFCDSPPSLNILPFLNFSPSLKFSPFPNFVTILRFYVRTASDTITSMQHSEFPALRVFVMHVDALPRPEAERLFRALSQCKACQTLEVIQVSSQEALKLRLPSNHFPATRQLLCFTQLQILHLCLDIYLGNDLFLEAMSSWPHIRSLEIRSENLCPPFVTFRGLFTALRLCPNLHHLRLSIDVRNIDVDPEVESFQHTSLLKLTVHSTYVERPKDVARIIFSMLPRVSKVMSHPIVGRGWIEVNKLLDSFRLSEIGEHAPTT